MADPGGSQANEEPARPADPAAEPHWLTLRFPDAGLEQEFRREHAARSLVPFRAGVLVGAVLYLTDPGVRAAPHSRRDPR